MVLLLAKAPAPFLSRLRLVPLAEARRGIFRNAFSEYSCASFGGRLGYRLYRRKLSFSAFALQLDSRNRGSGLQYHRAAVPFSPSASRGDSRRCSKGLLGCGLFRGEKFLLRLASYRG